MQRLVKEKLHLFQKSQKMIKWNLEPQNIRNIFCLKKKAKDKAKTLKIKTKKYIKENY